MEIYSSLNELVDCGLHCFHCRIYDSIERLSYWKQVMDRAQRIQATELLDALTRPYLLMSVHIIDALDRCLSSCSG